MFPITYKNRFIYTLHGDPRFAADKLRDHLAWGLAKEGAKNVVASDMVIRFDGSPWYPFRWHFFHTISKGKVTVDYRDQRLGVVYQISFIDYFVVYFAVMGCSILWLFVALGSPLSISLAIPFFFFGSFLGVNVAISYYRFNRFMKNRLREFFDSAAHSELHGELITTH